MKLDRRLVLSTQGNSVNRRGQEATSIIKRPTVSLGIMSELCRYKKKAFERSQLRQIAILACHLQRNMPTWIANCADAHILTSRGSVIRVDFYYVCPRPRLADSVGLPEGRGPYASPYLSCVGVRYLGLPLSVFTARPHCSQCRALY